MLRKARVKDVKGMHVLISKWAKKGTLLERSVNYIYENIRDYWIFEHKRKIIGVCALHVVGWDDLGEIKSLAVDKKYHKRGFGRTLVDSCIGEAGELGIKRIFVLTFIPSFFRKIGFKKISMNKLPHKIWSDCLNCIYFPNCREKALILTLAVKKK